MLEIIHFNSKWLLLEKIYYFDFKMSVHRDDVPGSWSQRNHQEKDYRIVRKNYGFMRKIY